MPLTPWHPKDKARVCQFYFPHRLLKQNKGLCSGKDNSHSFNTLWKPCLVMQGPFLLATSHRFDKPSHWITYMFFGNPYQCFVCYYYKAKVPAMKENQQIRLLSYLTINKIREKQLVLPLRSHRLDWSFYFTVLSRVWQRSMGWSGTHISLPSAGVAGPCYHTWLLQDTMSFKNILTNSYLGIRRGYWLIAGCQPIPSVSSLQTDHRVHNQSHS